ncbi:MAG TPA: adenosylcobinamide-GDP ribazoletransferase [Stellaceae bacterium]|nr:adenosylcobinamide-GDP ribazoletransferase [Stellaceae bacterium]
MIFDQFMLATGLLTRLPVAAPETEETTVAEASWAFPAVGAGIGMITAAAFFAASTVGLGASPAALLAILVGVAVTGALHEDGLADTADGFGGGRDREQKLAIMRDSRHGTYAMLALIFSIGLRAGALVAIGSPIEAGLALIAANAASRGVLPVIMRGLAPAREDGLGAAAGTPGPAPMLVAMAIGIFVALGMLGPIRGAVALVLAGIAVAATAMLARRQIGGYTGDTLGACQQIGEIVMLLAAATR